MDPHFWLKEDCIYVTNTSSATTPTPTTTKPVYFRGNYILQGIVQKVFQLMNDGTMNKSSLLSSSILDDYDAQLSTKLEDVTLILVSGVSLGALASILHLNQIQDMIHEYIQYRSGNNILLIIIIIINKK